MPDRRDHDAVVRLYADQIIEQADVAGQGEPVSALSMAEIDKAMMHFRTLDNGRSAAARLRQLAAVLLEAADVPGRSGIAKDVRRLAADYAIQAAQTLPD